MKKFALLSLLFCSVLFGCEKSESETPEPDVKEGTYVGTVTVDQTDGRFFSQENVSLTVTKTSDKAIVIHNFFIISPLAAYKKLKTVKFV